MEGLTRLVSESLARHGLDRPVDYRRLHWSRWFRCESAHSLLFVPSKPGVFALAEEIVAPGDMAVKRMLAVLQFCEDDDMAFVLDRMLSRQKPHAGPPGLRPLLRSLRSHRRRNPAPQHHQRTQSMADLLRRNRLRHRSPFATSLELSAADASVGRTLLSGNVGATTQPAHADPLEAKTDQRPTAPQTPASHLDSGAATNIHCPSPFPSGF